MPRIPPTELTLIPRQGRRWVEDLVRSKRLPTEEDLDEVVGAEDLRAVRADGSLVFRLVKRALTPGACERAFPALRRAVRWSQQRQAWSGMLGYFDKDHDRKRNRRGGRVAAGTVADLDGWADALPYLRELGSVLKRFAPVQHAIQTGAVWRADPKFVIGGTPFTTVTVNWDATFPVHRDAHNLPGSLAVLTAFKMGDYRGGWLVFPRYRVGVAIGERDVLLADVSEPHGNAPHRGSGRLSIVAYFRRGFAVSRG